MPAQVLRRGAYTIGGPATVAGFTLADGANNGVLGQGPIDFCGFFDLRPEQGEPKVAAPDSYRRNVIPAPDGARIRLSTVTGLGDDLGGAYNPIAVAGAGAYANVQLGAKTSGLQRVWAPDNTTGSRGSYMSLAILVASCDSGEVAQTWDTSTPNTLASMDLANTPGQVRSIFKNYVTVGPEVLSDLAGQGSTTYDLEELGGGARFVGVWLMAFWIGPEPSPTQVAQIVTWELENKPAPPRTGGLSYAFPVRRVQQLNNANVPGAPELIVAQWPMQRAGLTTMPRIHAGGGEPGCRVVVVNGSGLQLDARIEYHIGNIVDRQASPVGFQFPCGPSTALVPIPTALPPGDPANPQNVIPPYSYANLVLVWKAAGPPDGFSIPAIVNVTVS
jgi:hypothetical protein